MTIETRILDPSEGLQTSNYTGVCQFPFLQQSLFPETGGCMRSSFDPCSVQIYSNSATQTSTDDTAR